MPITISPNVRPGEHLQEAGDTRLKEVGDRRAPFRRGCYHGLASRPAAERRFRREGDDLMDTLGQAARDVVIGNRILAHEGVVDAYGHVSVRHPREPGRYFLSRSRAPELVELGDVIEYDLAGNAVGGDARAPYLERFIHGAIYEARPDVQAVVHAHAEAVLRSRSRRRRCGRSCTWRASFGARLPCGTSGIGSAPRICWW